MFRFFSVFAISILLLSAKASSGPIDYERLDTRLKILAAKPDMVGLAVGIVENGELTFAEGYGETHLDGLPVDENTVFRWASLSKSVAASVTGQLNEEGLLSFDDRVSEFDTSLRLPNAGHTRATVADVLAHRLGIVPNAYDLRLEDGRDPAVIRRSLGALKATCTLGDCHTYQNVAFDAASEIVANVTGYDYRAVVVENLFEPLGMSSGTLDRLGLKRTGNWARPYRQSRRQIGPRPTDLNDSYYRVPAAGGVNSSIRDLAEYMRAQMGLYPEALSPDVLAAIHEPRVRTLREQRSQNRRYGGRLKNASYGYGWRVYDYAGEHRVIGHRGAVRGYRAMILFDPERDTGIVALWNSSSRRPVGIQYEVMDMVYDLPRTDWLQIDLGGSASAVAVR
ncbi:MAG: serine hydrolase domain-containing protein [Pseudomonadota bacterium]